MDPGNLAGVSCWTKFFSCHIVLLLVVCTVRKNDREPLEYQDLNTDIPKKNVNYLPNAKIMLSQ